MGSKNLNLLWMLLQEAFSRPRLQRQPEPTAAMGDPQAIRAFHEQGSAGGALLPVYHFNALAASYRLPPNGTLVDLGSGSGQYLAYLAQRRPDISILGLDLAEGMVAAGQQFLAEFGLSNRVRLQVGDMTCFSSQLPERIHLISSIFALHHLPGFDDLNRCISEIAQVRKKSGCAVWLFDHARPKHPRTPHLFPEIFTPDAPSVFRFDSRNSLIASFSFKEICHALDSFSMGPMEHHCARFMRLYQVHWITGQAVCSQEQVYHLWHDEKLPALAYQRFAALRALFPAVRFGK